MSWDSWAELIVCEFPEGGKINYGAIMGQDGLVWAKTEGCPDVS